MPVTFRISSGWRWWQELGEKICRGTSADVVAPAAGFVLEARGPFPLIAILEYAPCISRCKISFTLSILMGSRHRGKGA
jgi:hypothetical protein